MEGEGENVRPRVSSGGEKIGWGRKKICAKQWDGKGCQEFWGFVSSLSDSSTCTHTQLLHMQLLHMYVCVCVCVCVSWLSYVAARSDFFPEHTRVKLSCIFSCLTNIEVKALTNNKPRKVEQSDTSSKEDWTVALVWQSFHNWVALVSTLELTRLRPNLTVVKKSTSFLINRCKKRRMFFNKHFLANTCVFYATNLPSSIFLATNTI